jgi:heme exporter protein CcmD
MGEYAAYVWSSYGLALLALVWIGVSARQQWRRELKQAQRRVQTALQDKLQEQGT